MFERTKYGIEYDPRQAKEHDSSLLGWVFVFVGVIALVSFAWTIYTRFTEHTERITVAPMPAPAAPPICDKPTTQPISPLPAQPSSSYANRPKNVRLLLMRLNEAERLHDIEMVVSTIEQLRALPGSPAADLDDALARRLGTLNVRRLFDLKSALWVKQVVVRRNETAARIAIENGSTLASLIRLNGAHANNIQTGSKLYVMDHPRFNLALRRRTRTADLLLNGKFFRRYDLKNQPIGANGAYPYANTSKFWQHTIGNVFTPTDRDEIETLLPTDANVTISEM